MGPKMSGIAMKNVTHAGSDAASDISGVVCYSPTMITANGIWTGDNPLSYLLTLFILQVIVVVLTTRALVFILKPFRQPRVIAEIVGGILLGPSVLGRMGGLGEKLFPPRSALTLETVAHIGLVYFLFLVGVEMDLNVIRRTGRKAMVIAIAGMILPFTIGTSTSFLLRHQISKNVHEGAFLLFLGVALSVTAFPVLARILAETKLLNSDLGRLSMSSAIINDMCAWILLALSIALANAGETALSSLWVMLSGIGYVLLCFYVVRPVMWWIVRRIPEGGSAGDFHISCILTGVMVAGFLTDAIGIHAVFGAFVYGLVIPNGQLGVALIEKLEDFVTGLLLPLFFVISGLKTDISKIKEPITVGLLILVFVLASVGKIAGTIMIALFYQMPFNEGVSLGFLMNTKGLVEMVVLNVGREKQVLDGESFAVLVLTSLAMTALVTPAVTMANRPSKRLVGYKRRNLQWWSNPDSELRMLACVHNTRHVPTIISLLEASNPTKRSPIFVYALHLVELTGRASAMLLAQNVGAATGRGQGNHSEHIFAAFESYEQHAGGVSVQTLTAASPYATMHEDICSLAEDKHVSLIILPFHKQLTIDGGMEATNPAIRTVNENVLAGAPCSVGILVDRGLSGGPRIAFPAGQHLSHQVAVLFFGGADDREALAYAWRMAEHPGISLSVVRFVPGEEFESPKHRSSETGEDSGEVLDSRVVNIVNDGFSREREQDEEYLSEFRLRNVNDESVVYTEKVVNGGEEMVSAIRGMDKSYDLYIVGRGQGELSLLTVGLTEFTECWELGPIGDLLASSDFAATVSVLVVQQYVSPELDSPGRPVEQYLSNRDQRARVMAGTHKGTTPAPCTNWNGHY